MTEDYEKYQKYVDYVDTYRKASNAATGSAVDANANVETKNVTTLSSEMFKPEEILLDYKETCIRIPMLSEYRSLNLSNAAAIVLYEALRQNNFYDLLKEGQLHRNHW